MGTVATSLCALGVCTDYIAICMVRQKQRTEERRNDLQSGTAATQRHGRYTSGMAAIHTAAWPLRY